MDIFSLGCVIAEIFRNGRPLFDYPRLLEYRNGDLEIDETYFDDEVQGENTLIKLILSMIQIDPKKRSNINQYLQIFTSESMMDQNDALPLTFHNILYPLGKTFQQSEFLLADDKIGLIYYNYDKIHREIFGEDSTKERLATSPMKPLVYEKIRRYNAMFLPNHKLSKDSKSQFEEVKEEIEESNSKKSLPKRSCEEGLILLNMITNTLPY